MERLVCFLYILLRDYLTSGEVEAIMKGFVENPKAQGIFEPCYQCRRSLEAGA